MPVRGPLGATVAALGRANGPWEGVRVGVGVEGVVGGEGDWALCRPRSLGPVTDGWPPRWVAVSVVRLICGIDSVVEIKRHCGR